MVYFILIAGLILIYAALRKGTTGKSEPAFKDVLNKNNRDSDMDSIIYQITELEERVNELENALLLLKSEQDTAVSVKKIEETLKFKKPEKDFTEKDDKSYRADEKMDNNVYINKQIYSLYDSGRTIEEIATILHIGKGEISLRLGLRK